MQPEQLTITRRWRDPARTRRTARPWPTPPSTPRPTLLAAREVLWLPRW